MAYYRRNSPVLSFIIGGILGGAAALMFAPASGRETRRNVTKNLDSLVRKANDRKNSIIRDAQRTAKELTQKAEDIYRTTSGYAAQTFSGSAQAIQLEIESIRKAINAAVNAYSSGGEAIPGTASQNELVQNELINTYEDESLPKHEGMGRRAN